MGMGRGRVSDDQRLPRRKPGRTKKKVASHLPRSQRVTAAGRTHPRLPTLQAGQRASQRVLHLHQKKRRQSPYDNVAIVGLSRQNYLGLRRSCPSMRHN